MPLANPGANLALLVEQPDATTGYRNYLPNPTGSDGGFGWAATVSTSSSVVPALCREYSGGPDRIEFGTAGGVTNGTVYAITARVPLTPGKYLSVSGITDAHLGAGSSSPATQIRVERFDAADTFIDGYTTTINPSATRWNASVLGANAASAAYATIQIKTIAGAPPFPAGATTVVKQLMVTETATNVNAAYVDRPAREVDVLTDAHNIHVVRQPEGGTMTVELYDPNLGGLDAATFFKRGYQVRLTANTNNVFVGTVDTCKTTLVMDGTKRVKKVTLVCLDGMSALAGMRLYSQDGFVWAPTPLDKGVFIASITNLGWTIGLVPVPWIIAVDADPAVGGTTAQPGTSVTHYKVEDNDDGVRDFVARISARAGCNVWVDRNGKLRVSNYQRPIDGGTIKSWGDADLLLNSTEIGDTLDESYNTVVLNVRNWNTSTSKWENLSYTFADQQSIMEGGPRTRTVDVIQVNATEAWARGIANNFLPTGVRRYTVRRVGFEVTTAKIAIAWALADIMERVDVPDLEQYEDASSAAQSKRITGIEHVITARTGFRSTWFTYVDLGIRPRFM